jgi:hypothetical protein
MAAATDKGNVKITPFIVRFVSISEPYSPGGKNASIPKKAPSIPNIRSDVIATPNCGAFTSCGMRQMSAMPLPPQKQPRTRFRRRTALWRVEIIAAGCVDGEFECDFLDHRVLHFHEAGIDVLIFQPRAGSAAC